MNNTGAAATTPETSDGASVDERAGPHVSQMEQQDQRRLGLSELFCKMEEALSRSSVQQPDDGVNLRAPKSRLPQVFQESCFIPGSVARDRELEGLQEVAGGAETLPHREDLMDQVLQTDDALFT